LPVHAGQASIAHGAPQGQVASKVFLGAMAIALGIRADAAMIS
jgi:hypothetical protein